MSCWDQYVLRCTRNLKCNFENSCISTRTLDTNEMAIPEFVQHNNFFLLFFFITLTINSSSADFILPYTNKSLSISNFFSAQYIL